MAIFGKDKTETKTETSKPFALSNEAKATIEGYLGDYGEALAKKITTAEWQSDVLEGISRAKSDWAGLNDSDGNKTKEQLQDAVKDALEMRNEDKDDDKTETLEEYLYKKARREIGAEKKLVLIKAWANKENLSWTENNATTVAECYSYSESIADLKEELVALDKLVPAIEELGKWKNKTTIKIPVSPSTVANKIKKRRAVIKGYKNGGIAELEFKLNSAKATI